MRGVARAAAIAAVAMVSVVGEAQAQLSETLGAELELTTACTLSGESETSGVDFGALDFGTQPATFVGLLQVRPQGPAATPRSFVRPASRA